MEQKHIYIVFSATPYFIGRAIRVVTGEMYNHASIALDEKLERMYGFSRRYYEVPLYGGFVRESLSRYHVNGKSTYVSICKIPVTVEQYTHLEDLFTEMYARRDHYLYNHIFALGALFHRRILAKDAYTCVEFCVQILSSLGIDLDPKKYYSVCDVQRLLQDYEVYTGEMYPAAEYDASYFARRPIPYPTSKTIHEIYKLLPRLANK